VILNEVNARLLQKAAKDPELKDTVDVMTTLMDLDSFAHNPGKFGAQKLNDWMLDKAFGHYAEQLAGIEAQFRTQYPSRSELHIGKRFNRKSLEDLHREYLQAVRLLRVPSGWKAFIQLGWAWALTVRADMPESERRELDRERDALLAGAPDFGPYVSQYERAKQEYTLALGATQFWLTFGSSQLETFGPKYAADITRRANALGDVSETLGRYADDVLPLAVFPATESAYFFLRGMADRFGGLADEMSAFAREVETRQDEYEQDYERLSLILAQLAHERVWDAMSAQH